MRVVGRVLLFVVGGLLLVVGAAAAWVVGPDDTVVAGETEFSGTAYTARGLLNVENLAVEVSAQAAEGEVFVGVGHPVDVSNVVAGHDAFRIFQVNVGSLAGAADAGEDEMPDPRGIDWFDSVSGEGEQTLSYPVDGVAPQFLVYSPDGAPVTASIGFTVAGAFAFCLVVAGVGLLLVVGGVLLRRRRAHAGSASDGDVEQDVGAEQGDGGQGDGGHGDAGRADGTEAATPDADEARTTAAGPVARRVAAVLGAGVLVLPLSACGVVPEFPAQLPDGEAPKVALSADRIDAMWADYDKRNNAAIKAAAAPTFDASKWRSADSGVVLAWDRYTTTYEKAESEVDGSTTTDKPRRWQTSSEWVSSPEFDAYPMWALVDRKFSRPSTAKEKKEFEKQSKEEKEKAAAEIDKYAGLALVVRNAADEPWTLRSTVGMLSEDVPDLPEVAATATEEQVATAEKVADAMNDYVSTGKKSKLLGDVGDLKELRKSLTDSLESSIAKDDGTASGSVSSGLFDDDSVRVLPGDGVIYAVVDQRHTLTVRHSDAGWHWDAPSDAVNGDSGSTLYRKQASTSLVAIPADGKADVLGTSYGAIVSDER